MKAKKALDWCSEYIEHKLNRDDVIVSDSDELENWISSGINLSTSAFSYGGLQCLSVLWKKMGKTKN